VLELQVVVIGGGFSYVTPDYTERVERAARRAAVLPAGRAVRVVRPALGGDAPLVGAGLLATL
jgi:glucokinase